MTTFLSGGGGSSLTSCGFTLAEVLITLGIIGIVAALTIPTLVANYQNKSWNTSASVFERKLEEALKTMNTQQSLAGYSNTADFVAELGKHFKINKVCKNNEIMSCFNDNITVEIIDISSGTSSEKVNLQGFKTAADLGQEDWDSEAIGLQFANGTTGVIAYNPQCKEQPFTNTFSGTSCVSLIYDTNGFKSPNTFTKDVRGVNSFLKACAFKSGNTCFSAPFNPDPLTKAECEELKDDLGIAACHYDNDYWAGAVKACGGVSKMPTMAQLADIANYVYNTSGIGSLTDQSDITLDYDKATALGFKYYEYTYQNSSFIVWSGEEDNRDGNTYAFYRFFDNNRSSWATYYRNSGSGHTQAICIGD